MLNVIFIGILIGILVSAPVGPIGILCIQRTISRGRLHGIVTGLGATTSDLIYVLIVGFCISYITEFITDYRIIIQTIGSIIVCVFGMHIFRSNPVAQLHRNDKSEKKTSYFNDYISAFGLCLSNPLIIFLFIGLFARFQLILPENRLGDNLIGLVAILIGATLWWIILTLIVGYFRNNFNLRGLWILNKITGSFLMLFGVIGIVTALLGISF